jgi:formyl-CoA transferase
MVRISGYGQTGPYAQRPGYGAICEAVAGVRHMTGDPDRPPARVALPATDYLSSVLAAYGAMVAIHERSRSGRGQVVDLALYEAAFTQMEQVIPAYEQLGIVPTRQGPNLASMAPNSLYPTRDGQYMLIAANNQAIWERLRAVMEVPGLAEDPRFASIRDRGRPENVHALNDIVARWSATLDADALEALLQGAEVPASRVNTIADIYRDEHFQAREMLLRVPHPTLGHTTQMGVVPKLSATPGGVRATGPDLGMDTREVLAGELGWSDRAIERLLAEMGAAAPGRPG